VTVYRELKEFGEMEVVADSEDEAREDARMALDDDDDAIHWRTDTLRLEGQRIERVERLE
jgi:hypothetical protein